MRLTAFHALSRSTAKLGGMAERLTIESLAYRPRVLELFPFDDTVTEFVDLVYFS
jgi:hypothetical protein